MISLWRIFWLECVALVRTRTFPALLVASGAWLFAVARFLTVDATGAGGSELYVRYGLGGVLALLVVALLGAATGAIATERAEKRLQLAQVRPVSPFALAYGRFLALSLAGALVLLAAAAAVALDGRLRARTCSHVHRPLLISPRAEAEQMYDIYMADPETPAEIKKTARSVVLRILEQKAKDNYLSIQTNETAAWSFPGLGAWAAAAAREGRPLSVRFKFSNSFSMRDDVRGEIFANGLAGVVSNITQTAVTIPLRADGSKEAADDVLAFTNTGRNAVMLRPRQDVEVLVPADSFVWNLFRACLVMIAVLSGVIAFGVFLGAGLSRPVALFAAMVLLAVGEMSTSVVEQYPDQLETNLVDRLGLAVTRAVGVCAKPVSELAPIGQVADGDCVETARVLEVAAIDLVVLPVFLCALAGVLIRRKTQ